MIISATDFQLRVNEYFTKIMKGESVVIERYGKKFAKLVPYEEKSSVPQPEKVEESKLDETTKIDSQKIKKIDGGITITLDNDEQVEKLLNILLREI